METFTERLSRSPYYILAVCAVSIFCVEGGIMYGLQYYWHLAPRAEGFLDSLLLTAILFPVLFLLVFRPMKRSISRQLLMERNRSNLEEQLRMIEEKRREEELFRNIADGIPHIVWVTRPDGYCEYMNRPGLEYPGLSMDKIVGDGWRAIIHPDDLPELLRRWEDSARTDRPILDVEGRLRRADGQYRLFNIRALPLRDADGRIIRWFGTCTDIEDARSLQNQLRQSQKMEAVGQLAGGVAHDFNNILTGIFGHITLAMGGVDTGHPAAGDMREIQLLAARAADLTSQLLIFARRQTVHPVVLNLNDAVRDALKLVCRLIGSDIEVGTNLSREPAWIRADAGHIHQILINLSVNARDAMPGGGKLTFETRVMPACDDSKCPIRKKELPCVCLFVRDTGSGISDEIKNRIFEPFFTTKETGKGTGLGLATCHGIVEQSGGHISVDSAPGGGTTFRICMPCVAEGPEASSGRRPKMRSGDIPGGSESVLLVEDDRTVRTVTVRSLQTLGYVVEAFANPEECLRRLDAGVNPPPTMLMTDIVMPGMNGKELARRVRIRIPKIRILYTSGYADRHLDPADLSGPGAAFLQKPYHLESLAKAIREGLSNRL